MNTQIDEKNREEKYNKDLLNSIKTGELTEDEKKYRKEKIIVESNKSTKSIFGLIITIFILSFIIIVLDLPEETFGLAIITGIAFYVILRNE